ncbi:hypothetical protein M422DRAFT_264394 [Sphaerobolus stellatus SS14]|uniref:Uncharacterized protein n=1 Tax=Sphaerobolus stellatus (strain SS14) TaxID=990650 RepID=A0A0C9TTI3_SPHS4|nr:hypothetical protein M422DRAFT_264394 [Sphaerobolus stellatus SS14]
MDFFCGSVASVPLQNYPKLRYLPWVHPSDRPGPSTQSTNHLQSSPVLGYYCCHDFINSPRFHPPASISLSGIKILIFRNQYPKGWMFSLDLFDGLSNVEFIHINWSRGSTDRVNNTDMLCAPNVNIVLPSLKTLEFKNISFHESFIFFAVVPPEGVQISLPVLRYIIFHESAMLALLHPALDIAGRKLTSNSPAIHVVPESGLELQHCTSLADYLVKLCGARFISARENRKDWEICFRDISFDGF